MRIRKVGERIEDRRRREKEVGREGEKKQYNGMK